MSEEEKKKQQHGERNLDLCKQLLSDGKYHDWIVTTAFYSAVQFVEYAVFPVVIKSVKYSDFEEYYDANSKHGSPNKHNIRKRLVSDQIPSIKTQYRELLDDCHTARYYTYEVSPNTAIEAKKKAEFIRSECLKHKQ